mgnify:CR=1 FL=1
MITDDIKAALEGVTQWPWYFHDGGPYTHVRSQADRILICVLSWHSSTRLHHPLKPETLANTKLIAAAPDLLYRALGEIESLQAQLRTYGDQRAAEAREQMREECIAICDSHAESCEEMGDMLGMKTADRIADEIKELE